MIFFNPWSIVIKCVFMPYIYINLLKGKNGVYPREPRPSGELIYTTKRIME